MPGVIPRFHAMDRSAPVWVLAAAVLAPLILLPLGWLGSMSVSAERGVTLAHYARVFADPQLQKALWNTVVLAFWSGLLSVAIGAPIAWLSARTDLPGSRAIRSVTGADEPLVNIFTMPGLIFVVGIYTFPYV